MLLYAVLRSIPSKSLGLTTMLLFLLGFFTMLTVYRTTSHRSTLATSRTTLWTTTLDWILLAYCCTHVHDTDTYFVAMLLLAVTSQMYSAHSSLQPTLHDTVLAPSSYVHRLPMLSTATDTLHSMLTASPLTLLAIAITTISMTLAITYLAMHTASRELLRLHSLLARLQVNSLTLLPYVTFWMLLDTLLATLHTYTPVYLLPYITTAQIWSTLATALPIVLAIGCTTAMISLATRDNTPILVRIDK